VLSHRRAALENSLANGACFKLCAGDLRDRHGIELRLVVKALEAEVGQTEGLHLKRVDVRPARRPARAIAPGDSSRN
jgi:hypothetical protein